MSDGEQQELQPSAQPVAPPIQPGAITAPQRPSNWHAVIGTIAIVFGSLGCLQGFLGILSPLFMALLSQFIPEEQADIIQQAEVRNVVSSVIGFLIAVLLLVGGIRIRGKRRRAVVLLRRWAMAKLLFAVVGTFVGYESAQLYMESVQPGPSASLWGTSFFQMFGVVGMAIGLLWMCALPGFMLVWFSRKKIKAEIEGWT